MGHGTVADEIKGRASTGPSGSGGSSNRGGRACASAPTSTAPSASSGPRPRWRSRPRWAPTSPWCSTSARRSTSTRDYTARSTERTHRWLERCLDWHAEHGPEGQLVYGIVQGGVHEDLRAERASVAASRCDGIAIGGSLGPRRRRCTRSSGGRPPCCRRTARATCSASARSTTCRAASSSGSTLRLRDAHPPRTPRHGARARSRAALARRPHQGRWRDSDEPLMDGCPCPACARLHPRLPALPGASNAS